MPCIKHNYHQVNNRYDEQGKPVIEGGEWVTEIRCEVCDKKFDEPKWKEKVTISSPSLITGHLFAVIKK
jgi:hypothetical protein